MPKIKQDATELDEEDEDDEDEDELEVQTPIRKSKKPKTPRFILTAPIPLRAMDSETEEIFAEADITDAKSICLMNTQLILLNRKELEDIKQQIGLLTS